MTNSKLIKPSNLRAPHLGTAVGLVLLMVIVYIGALILFPRLPSIPYMTSTSIDLDLGDDISDSRDRIQIERMGIEVPFFEGTEAVLEQGAWHRKPENGNPKDGGNFILAGHRFEIGNTPGQTKQKSPFYHIDSLKIGDKIRIYYQNEWYEYSVADKQEVSSTALYIEDKSVEPRLTLYSCLINGAAAGRYVIIAKPIINN